MQKAPTKFHTKFFEGAPRKLKPSESLLKGSGELFFKKVPPENPSPEKSPKALIFFLHRRGVRTDVEIEGLAKNGGMMIQTGGIFETVAAGSAANDPLAGDGSSVTGNKKGTNNIMKLG